MATRKPKTQTKPQASEQMKSMIETAIAEDRAEIVDSKPIEFTIQDMAVLKNIIEVASSRGAFKPDEMVFVGQTYTKLADFLKSQA
jgi:hypothetical protein